MKEFFQNIGLFFTESIPNFCSKNYLVLEISLLVLFVLTLIIALIVGKRRRKQLKNSEEHITEWVGRLNEKTLQCNKLLQEHTDDIRLVAELQGKISSLETEYASLNSVYTETKTELEKVANECRGKCHELAEVTNELKTNEKEVITLNNIVHELKEKLATSEGSLETEKLRRSTSDDRRLELDCSLDSAKEEIEKLKTAYAALVDEKKNLEKELTESKDLNEKFKNYELENVILLDVLRRLSTETNNSKIESEKAMVLLEERLSQKMDNIDRKLVRFSIPEDLESLTREELLKLARQVGMKGYSKLSKSELINEIKKYKV